MEINEAVLTSKEVKRKKFSIPRIDMTPMVDLGFLLITFFIFTTTMSASSVTSLIMPMEGPPVDIEESRSMTVLLGSNDQVAIYEGRWEDALQNQSVIPTSYDVKNGLGQMIRNKQNRMALAGLDKNKLVLLIKPMKTSSYKNLIDALDEVMINNVQYYAVDKPTGEEEVFLN